MKKILFLIMTICAVSSFAAQKFTQNDNSNLLATESSSEIEKWDIIADTWIIEEGKWYEYPQLIRICWSEERGLYMWCIGGYTADVKKSNKRGYDYMVDNPRGDWRFYFNRSDLK